MSSSPPRRSASINLQWDSPSALKRVRRVCFTAETDSEVHVFALHDLFEETSSLRELWEARQLCDVVLQASDGLRVPGHKIVLASVSPFFRALFAGAGQSMKEWTQKLATGENVVELRGVDGIGLEAVLKAIYTRNLEVSPKNLESLLSCSNHLEILPIQEACCQYLRRCLGVHNCLEILELAERYNCDDLGQEVLHYVCGKFSELLNSVHWQRSVGLLSKSSIMDILRSDDIDVDSECQVLEVGLAWVKANLQSRIYDLPAILSTVRMSQQFITQELHNHNLMNDSQAPAWTTMPVNLVNAGSQRGGSGSSELAEASIFGDEGLCAPRRRTPTGLMVAGGHDADWRSLKLVEIYNPHRDEWAVGPPMPTSFSFTGAASVSGSVLVIGGTMYSANVCKYGTRARKWSNCPPLNTARVHSAVTSMGGVVYVLGGRTGVGQPLCSVECYECHGSQNYNGWSEGASMHFPRSALGAGAFGGRVYAAGGQAGRTIYSSVECLDAERGEWHVLGSHLNMGRKYVAVGVVGGRLYVLGGMNEQRVRLATVEAYDPREGRWQEVGSMHVARSSCGAATLHDRLYVIGGNAGDDVIHDTVECFLPETNQWVPCASISCGRSGLSAVPV